LPQNVRLLGSVTFSEFLALL